MRCLLFIMLLALPCLCWAQRMDSIVYFKSGKKQYEGNVRNGKKEGLWKAYFESGKLRMEGKYKRGKPEGYWTTYYENGNKRKTEFYQNGKVGGREYSYSGTSKEYYENGNLKEEYTWRKGKLSGLQKQYYPNGVLRKEAICVNGFFEGPMKEYYDDNILKAETVYENGEPTGLTRSYYRNGKIKMEGPMPDSTYLEYDSLGNKTVCRKPFGPPLVPWDMKPVIYLYPEKERSVSVKLDYKGEFIFTYPAYNNEWKVKAFPDGRLINEEDKLEYSYLFWEGKQDVNWLNEIDTKKGFVISGSKATSFLQKKFAELGLTPKEYNELLVFWLPKMIHNRFNYIHFLVDEEYDKVARINVEPKPDAMRRVYIILQPLENEIEVVPQMFSPFERKGFSVIEWGGTETNNLIKEF